MTRIRVTPGSYSVAMADDIDQSEIYGFADDDTQAARPSHPPLAPDAPQGDPAGKAPKSARCPDCGYDLRGSRLERCPECGRQITPSVLAHAERKARIKQQNREYYRTPLIAAGVGLTIAVVIAGLTHTWTEAAAVLIGFPIDVLVGWVIYAASAFTWLGLNQSMKISAVQLMGVYGAYAGTASVLLLIPLPILTLPLLIIAFVALLHQMLEIEIFEALVLAILTVVAWFLIGMVVAPLIGI